MRKYRTTDEQIDFIIKGLDRFIDYVSKFHNDCFEYYENMEVANKKYKKSPATFFDDIGVTKEHFFDGLSYYRVLHIAKNVKNDIYNIHNTVIGMFIDPRGNEYPIKVKEWLHHFEMFCYDDNGVFLSLEEQNNRLKNYPHFDASVKRPQCYNTQ